MDAEFIYSKLRDDYGQFQYPFVVLTVDEQDLAAAGVGLQVTDIRVESSIGYEASVASFKVLGLWDDTSACFKSKLIEKYLKLGAGVAIAAGYSGKARLIYMGYISKLNYVHKKSEAPGVLVSCMDIKGLMMSGAGSRTFPKAKCYSDAVEEILKQYEDGMKNTKTPALANIIVDPTPDKPEGGGSNEETPKTIEMVDESDYEFVVKAAKKFNFEFLVSAGVVAFRKARSNEDILMDIDFAGFKDVDIEQNMTGQVESVEVKSMNAGTGVVESVVAKKSGSDTGTVQLKKIIAGTKKSYIDSSCFDKTEMKSRAEYLLEENSYKFVTLRASTVGLPEFTAGRFITLVGLHEDGAKVKFYIHQVVHKFQANSGYTTEIICRAKTINKA